MSHEHHEYDLLWRINRWRRVFHLDEWLLVVILVELLIGVLLGNWPLAGALTLFLLSLMALMSLL